MIKYVEKVILSVIAINQIFLQNSGRLMTEEMVCLFYELPGALAPESFF